MSQPFEENNLPYFVILQDQSTISPNIIKSNESKLLSSSINSTPTGASSGNGSMRNTPELTSNHTNSLLSNSTTVYPEIHYHFKDDQERLNELEDDDNLILVDFDSSGKSIKHIKSLASNWQVSEVDVTEINEIDNLEMEETSKTKNITIKGTSSELYLTNHTNIQPNESLHHIKNLIELFRLRNYQLQKVINQNNQ